jgi:hypothetical protein
LAIGDSPVERVINASMSDRYQLAEILERNAVGAIKKFSIREIGDLGVKGFSAEVRMKTEYEVTGFDAANHVNLVRKTEETFYSLEKNPNYEPQKNNGETEYRYKIMNYKYHYNSDGELSKMDETINYQNVEPEENTGKTWSTNETKD